MDLTLLAGPIIGAIIGYFTNYIAVKMLFRPFEPKYIFGCRIPFTPGMIPGSRNRIAESIGSAVGDNLLTEDAMETNLLSPEIKDKIRRKVENTIQKEQGDQRQVREVITRYLMEDETLDTMLERGGDLASSYTAYRSRRESLLAAQPLTPDQEAQLRAIDYRLTVLDTITESLNEMQPDDVQIALTHHPLTSETIKTLQQWAGSDRNDFFRGVSLVLAGHYCGGQMRLPLLGAIRAPESLSGWFPKDSEIVGLSTVQGVTQYISPGLGASAIYPIRFRMFNTPAVTVLTLTSVLSF